MAFVPRSKKACLGDALRDPEVGLRWMAAEPLYTPHGSIDARKLKWEELEV